MKLERRRLFGELRRNRGPCFHADGALQAALELIVAEVLDEAGQIVAFGLRRPDNGFTFRTCDRGEGAPLVDGEAGVRRRLLRATGGEETTERSEYEE